MTDPYYVYRPLLDLTGKSEGTDRARGYNETLGYGAYTGGDRELVKMTLDQIEQLQTAMLAHPKNRWNSSALGRYQIVRTTLREIRAKLKLSGTALFDASMQDRMACYLLGKRGIDRWLTGQMTLVAIINALAKEWASLPNSKGVGHYDGQRASVTISEVQAALAMVKARDSEMRARPAPTPVPRDNPAPPVARPVPSDQKRGGWIAAIIAIFKAIFGGGK